MLLANPVILLIVISKINFNDGMVNQIISKQAHTSNPSR